MGTKKDLDRLILSTVRDSVNGGIAIAKLSGIVQSLPESSGQGHRIIRRRVDLLIYYGLLGLKYNDCVAVVTECGRKWLEGKA